MYLLIAVPLLMLIMSVAAAQSTQPATASAAASASVPVRRVVLYSSGVGYFEHYGTVHEQASAELRFKTQQINDILKSLVLQDLDGGKVGVVTYPSQDPLNKILRSFQVDLATNPSLAELLNQLRGAKVQLVMVGQAPVRGTILSVEKRAKPAEKGVVEQAVLNVLSGGTIRAVELEQVSYLDLEDPQLQQELAKALEAVAQARDQDKKPVTIQFAGEGERRVRLGYVVETPIWKTSYRLILPAGDSRPARDATKPAGDAGPANELAGAEKPSLQGWAIVENQTDNDWNNVQLSLVSGRPISFIQDLYQPLYLPRPVVQAELYASLRPQTYAGGMDEAAKKPMEMLKNAEADKRSESESSVARRGVERAAGRPMAPATPAPMGGAGLGGAAGGDRDGDGILDASLNAAASVASIASASKMGELFQYTVGNVSLPRQRSAMIPIITDAIEIERLSIYNQSVLARNPLNGARIKNTTGKHLLQGPVTVLDANAYAGDARIDNVPPGQERLLSYGVDLEMLVDATKNTSQSTIVAGKIVKGVLFLSRRVVFSQDYVADNKSEKDKTLIIEHPVRPGWKLLEPEKPLETTEAVYRFKGAVPAGKSSKMTVKQEIVQGEQLAILPSDVGQLEYYARSGEISPEVQAVLVKTVALKQAMVQTQQKIAEKQQELKQITDEQNRLRENMKTVAQNTEYYQRLLTKLNDQETQIEGLQKELDGLKQTLEQQRKALEDYLMSIDTTTKAATR